jgi:hypothetical protein
MTNVINLQLQNITNMIIIHSFNKKMIGIGITCCIMFWRNIISLWSGFHIWNPIIERKKLYVNIEYQVI